MRLSLDRIALAHYVGRQLSVFFPDRDISGDDLRQPVNRALERLEHCFSRIRTKYYADASGSTFDHLNTDHYLAFIYLLSREAWAVGDLGLAAKLYALNKALHAVDIFYEIELPSVFLLRHPVGTVLGRASYADYLCVYQSCVVGSGMGGEAPIFAGPAILFGGAQVVGQCAVGPNAWISLGTQIVDTTVPGNSVVFGHFPNLVIRPTCRDVVLEIFSG